MQTQYGKDVLGAVCLQEARKHQSEAKDILEKIASQEDSDLKRQLMAQTEEEKHRSSQLKGSDGHC